MLETTTRRPRKTPRASDQHNQPDSAADVSDDPNPTAAQYQAIFELAPEAILVVDTAGRCLAANPAALAQLGYAADETPELSRKDIFVEDADWIARMAASVIRDGVWHGDVTVRAKDGHAILTAARMALLTGGDGPTIAVYLHRRVDPAQGGVTPARLAAIVASSSDAIVGQTLGGIVTDWNPAAERLFGYTAAEMIGQPFTHLAPPERVSEIDQLFARVRRGERVEGFETVRCGKHGRRLDVALTVFPVRDKAGEIVATSAIVRDISARKAAEAALATSEARYRALVEQVPAVIYTEPRFESEPMTYVSPYVETFLGYPADDVLADRELWTRSIHPDDRERVRAAATRRHELGTPFAEDYRMMTRDGRTVWVSDVATPIRDTTGKFLCWQGMALDITARKDAEEALTASEALFRAAFENAPIGMALISPDWRLLAVNRADCELLGYTEDELLATTFLGATHPDDIAITRAVVTRALAGEGDQYQLEKRYLRKDGQTIWVHLSVSLIRDEDGAPRYFISQAQDITARKEAEADLHATQQRTRDVLERISDGFYALDRAWRFTYLNHAAERILDERREALLGRVIWETFPTLKDTPLAEAYQQVMDEGNAAIFEFYSPRLDRWFEVRAHSSAEGLSAFFCDITERKRVDDEIRAALEAARTAQRTTGQFLAMMSHELRTPLQAILGYADFLLHGPSGALTREQAEDIGYIEQGARRMSALVDQMLDLSRIEAGRLQLVLEPVDLSQVIEQVRQDIAPQAAAKDLDLDIDVPPSPPLIRGDPVRLHQILLNLVSNAVKFTERGSIRVSVTEVDGGVDVAVQDTGIGIVAETLPHIFEAFRQADSTVNRRYGGAGLGLAIARQLAELMGGQISVVSHPGDGSTFTLHLPTSKARATRRSGRKTRQKRYAAGETPNGAT